MDMANAWCKACGAGTKYPLPEIYPRVQETVDAVQLPAGLSAEDEAAIRQRFAVAFNPVVTDYMKLIDRTIADWQQLLRETEDERDALKDGS